MYATHAKRSEKIIFYVVADCLLFGGIILCLQDTTVSKTTSPPSSHSVGGTAGEQVVTQVMTDALEGVG